MSSGEQHNQSSPAAEVSSQPQSVTPGTIAPLEDRVDPGTAPSALPRQDALEYLPAPGSLALRLEGLEFMSPQAKSRLMDSIAADISAIFISIKQHVESGILQDIQTRVIDEVIKLIRDTDVNCRRGLMRRVRHLHRDRKWIHARHMKLTRRSHRLSLVLWKRLNANRKLQEERDSLLEYIRSSGLEVPPQFENADDRPEVESREQADIEG